jgi:ferrous iron transport protein B
MGIITSFDILGIGLISEDSAAISEEIGADTAVYKQIAAYFTVYSAFAYLLFVLMYFPCLAVIGAARQEMGGFYAGVMAVYSTMLAWAVATLFYQIAEGHNIFYVILSFLILAAIYGGLHLLGKREKSAGQVAFAPPIRKSCCS